MDIIKRMATNEGLFSKSELKVYHFLQENLDMVETETINRIGILSDTSTSAVLRFCQTLGYKGYKDFRFDTINYLRESAKGKAVDSLDATLNYYERAISSFKSIDRNLLDQLVKDLKRSSEKHIIGIYSSSIPAKFLHLGLVNQGILNHHSSDINEAAHHANLISADDVLIYFSISGDNYIFKRTMSAISENMPRSSYLITLNPKADCQQYFSNVISLPDYTFSKSSVIERQSFPMIFIELLLNQLHSNLE